MKEPIYYTVSEAIKFHLDNDPVDRRINRMVNAEINRIIRKSITRQVRDALDDLPR